MVSARGLGGWRVGRWARRRVRVAGGQVRRREVWPDVTSAAGGRRRRCASAYDVGSTAPGGVRRAAGWCWCTCRARRACAGVGLRPGGRLVVEEADPPAALLASRRPPARSWPPAGSVPAADGRPGCGPRLRPPLPRRLGTPASWTSAPRLLPDHRSRLRRARAGDDRAEPRPSPGRRPGHRGGDRAAPGQPLDRPARPGDLASDHRLVCSPEPATATGTTASTRTATAIGPPTAQAANTSSDAVSIRGPRPR